MEGDRQAVVRRLSYATPTGEPRSSGVVYRTVDRRLYVAVAPDGWKARHVAASGRVAVTVPVPRGGILSLVLPIPPATISFRAAAGVHAPGSPETGRILDELASLLPAERRLSASIVEIVPRGTFVTYGVGVPLMKMRDPLPLGLAWPYRTSESDPPARRLRSTPGGERWACRFRGLFASIGLRGGAVR